MVKEPNSISLLKVNSELALSSPSSAMGATAPKDQPSLHRRLKLRRFFSRLG